MQLIQQIGLGKHATVYEGLTDFGKQVAVKQLNPDVQQNTPKRERIFRSAGIWAGLTHRRLVSYLDVDRAQGQIVMELMRGNARTKLGTSGCEPAWLRQFLEECLQGLKALHDAGYIHANLRPSNILFDQDGAAKISDGLNCPIANPGVLPPPGSQKYLAPEQTAEDRPQIGPMMDLYCLGFVALELLAGSSFDQNFAGIGAHSHEDDAAWFQWHSSADPAPPAKDLRGDCPSELALFIDRLVVKQPLERFHTASQALAELPTDLRRSVVASQVTAPAQAGPTPAKRTATAGDISKRPATGVVLRIASGPLAGSYGRHRC